MYLPHLVPGQGFPNVPPYFISEGLTPSRRSGEGGQDQSEEPHRGRTSAPGSQAVPTAYRGWAGSARLSHFCPHHSVAQPVVGPLSHAHPIYPLWSEQPGLHL